MEVVGGAFLSSAFDVLFDRLAPEGDLLKMFRKRKNDVQLLEKLKSTLLGLQAVLSDAENKQASNQYVREWLNKLRVAVDSAENLIEQVNYEALKLKVEGKHQNLAETLLKNWRFCNLCLGDDSFLKINDKLEMSIETLQNLQKQISDLGLQERFGSTKQETRTSTCLVDESGIFGLHKEKKDMIDRLLSEDASGGNLTVVPIVGIGGLGKTTLAKVVYNDEKVTNHFGLRAWYCVSEPYDALRITKGLLQEIGSFDLKDDGNLNQLQVKLKESLKGKKFLVVLDDVWNDDYNEWDNLRNVFVQGDRGSKIIVTTRKGSVAKTMCADHCAITVGPLSSEDSWALFKQHSLENSDHPELEEVGKEIAVKCKGLPLALKTVAGTLRGKSEVDEWRNILRSELWDQRCLNGILPALMLSYNDLPPHLKRCFAFCAIYPKDYEFCKDQATYLWIANGLVKQFCSGNEYFDELRSRSLLERVPESTWQSERFIMHDLINDLAQTASSKLCIRLEESKGSDDMLEQSRHMSYSMGREVDFEKLKLLSKSEKLRTLLPTNISYPSRLSKRVLHNILPRLTSLRALSLSGYVLNELPNDLFIKLNLLRFLNLSQTHIRELPDSICALYNLETLLLSSCPYLWELPLQMEKLINLHHLDITNTNSLNMLPHLSKLKSLQVLVGVKFLVGGSGGWRMEDLGEVHNLYGSLSVQNLQNVVDKRDALKAKMREKNHVDKLSLTWRESTAYDSQTEREILDELQPHTNIKQVEITGYRGKFFSNWLADPLFLKLVQLSLRNCKDCDSLPALGQLPCLKFLYIRGMHGITEVTEEFYGNSSSKKPFNSLEKLEFADMPEWKQWHVLGSGEFPFLEYLSIENCPKLMGKLPENLSLTKLRISETPLFEEAQLLRSQFEGMKQIVELVINNCNSLTSLPFSILPSSLKKIEIYDCQKLKLEEPVGYCNMFLEELKLEKCDSIDEFLPRARKLSISSCQNVTRFLIPTATESLTIWGCENLEILSVAVESAMTSLDISYCEKLKCLPEIELFNLQVLKINDCMKLVNGRKEWCLQRLTELEIKHDGSDEEIQHWELPSSIKILSISNLKTLSSQVLKSLTSLQYLVIDDLPQIQSLLEQGGLPSSLSELSLFHHDELHSLHLCHLTSLLCLHIWKCHNLQSLSESTLPSCLSELTIDSCNNLQSLSESALPSSLSQLTIIYCRNLQSLSESTLPSSLSQLTINNCPKLQSLSESTLPSSLSKLTIKNCPKLQSLSESTLPSSLSQLIVEDCRNLQSLPVKGMPSSLSKLVICRCPLLKPLLEFDKGKYWPNIAQIPIIQIDWKYL